MQSEVEEIRLAGLLHDIGKVGIPEPILNKSGPLDATEWETMKTHTELGAKILEPLEAMKRIRLMVRHHHEFYDGTGYPDRMEGERIPYGARVIAIADAYDTITSERTYKKARTPEDAFLELERCAANQFDPALVRVFIETMRRAPRQTVEAGVRRPERPQRFSAGVRNTPASRHAGRAKSFPVKFWCANLCEPETTMRTATVKWVRVKRNFSPQCLRARLSRSTPPASTRRVPARWKRCSARSGACTGRRRGDRSCEKSGRDLDVRSR